LITLQQISDMSQLVLNNLSPINTIDQENKIIMDVKDVDNLVLRRLLEEIDFEKHSRVNAYNRTHNRHNRGR
jgi:hypothetical protein